MQSIDHCTVRDFYLKKNSGKEIRPKTPKSGVQNNNEIWQLMTELKATKITVKEFLFLSAAKYEPLQLITNEDDGVEGCVSFDQNVN